MLPASGSLLVHFDSPIPGIATFQHLAILVQKVFHSSVADLARGGNPRCPGGRDDLSFSSTHGRQFYPSVEQIS